MTPGRKKSASRRDVHKEFNKRQEFVDKHKGNKNTNLADINPNIEPWTPGSYVALKALLSARLCSAIWGIINDCDEVYNYWEPTHFLLFGKGFQTWEYSPQYGLRSYTYLLLHAVPAYIYAHLLQSNRMLLFFFIRCLLALAACGCELYFYRGICKEFGANIGRIFLGISVFSAGMFISSTAYLPSSFAMYMTMLSIGAWFHNSLQLAIFTTAISALLGWPFAALLGVPIAFDIVFRRKKHIMFIKWSFISAVTILLPMVQIDSQYYGRLVIAPLNILMYNVFTSHGPDLYGTAPSSFYFINGFLNFNIMFPAAIFSVPFYMFLTSFSIIPKRKTASLPIWLSLLPLYLWLIVFTSQPHKEERFLFPIYPLLSVAAAFSIDCLQKLFFNIFVAEKKEHYLNYTNWLALTFVVFSATLGISRIVGQYQAYHAPFDIYVELNRLDQEGEVPNLRNVNICYGREWHRFPSSFFVPGHHWNVQFIESEFRGQLPQPFSFTQNGTSIIPPNMNDLNEEEPSRYVALSSCHFLIDLDREEESEKEPRYSARSSHWKVIHSVPFLEAAKSPQLLRAFYIPFLTEKYCTYVNYSLMVSTKFNIKNTHR